MVVQGRPSASGLGIATSEKNGGFTWRLEHSHCALNLGAGLLPEGGVGEVEDDPEWVRLSSKIMRSRWAACLCQGVSHLYSCVLCTDTTSGYHRVRENRLRPSDGALHGGVVPVTTKVLF